MLGDFLPGRLLVGASDAAQFARYGQDILCHSTQQRDDKDAVRMARPRQPPAVLLEDNVCGPMRLLLAPPVSAGDGERIARLEL